MMSNQLQSSVPYTLSLHDALPICIGDRTGRDWHAELRQQLLRLVFVDVHCAAAAAVSRILRAISISPDRKSTRLNSSHANISYAVFCLIKKYNNVLSNGSILILSI